MYWVFGFKIVLLYYYQYKLQMHSFYCPSIINNPILSEEESNHAVRVLRLVNGDDIRIYDGIGNIYLAKITQAHHKHTICEIIDTTHIPKPRNYSVQIAIAPTKNIDRLEWFVEKVCEIGIDRITPLFCRFSERKQLKTERLHKISIAALKQSQQAYLPIIDEGIEFNKWIKNIEYEQRFIAHCYKNYDKKDLTKACLASKNTIIAIGPEGDFSEEEILLASNNNFVSISLGENRLRTETAGIVACHIVHIINQIK